MPFDCKENQPVPAATLKEFKNRKLIDVPTSELFPAGKTVVLFALPGAFTPTCSESHVPGYERLYDQLKENGVDSVVCVAVNDPFVMYEWGRQQRVKNVRLVSDGNGEFTKALGLLHDFSTLCFGNRSWRHSMLVKDAKIVKQFIEPEKPGDPFEVSDAKTMLNYINPKARPVHDIVVFTRPDCPFCAKVKEEMAKHKLRYEEVQVGPDQAVTASAILAMTGVTSVPQTYVNGKYIGDSEKTVDWINKNC